MDWEFFTIEFTDADIKEMHLDTGCKYASQPGWIISQVCNENIRSMWETYSKVTTKTVEQNEKYPSGARDKFRTWSNIEHGASRENILRLKAVDYFKKTLYFKCLTGFWMHLPLVPFMLTSDNLHLLLTCFYCWPRTFSAG